MDEQQFKSKAFGMVDPESYDQLRSDLSAFVGLSEGDLLALVKVVGDVPSRRGTLREGQSVDALVPGIPSETVLSVIRLLALFAKAEAADWPDRLADDVILLVESLATQREAIGLRLGLVRGELSKSVARGQAVLGLGPAFERCATTVELRAVKTDQGVNGQPDAVGVISVRVEVDTGKAAFFQAAPQQVRELIKQLNAALKELERFEAAYRKTE